MPGVACGARGSWSFAPGVALRAGDVASPREIGASRWELLASERELGTVLNALTVRRWHLSPEGAAYDSEAR